MTISLYCHRRCDSPSSPLDMSLIAGIGQPYLYKFKTIIYYSSCLEIINQNLGTLPSISMQKVRFDPLQFPLAIAEAKALNDSLESHINAAFKYKTVPMKKWSKVYSAQDTPPCPRANSQKKYYDEETSISSAQGKGYGKKKIHYPGATFSSSLALFIPTL